MVHTHILVLPPTRLGGVVEYLKAEQLFRVAPPLEKGVGVGSKDLNFMVLNDDAAPFVGRNLSNNV